MAGSALGGPSRCPWGTCSGFQSPSLGLRLSYPPSPGFAGCDGGIRIAEEDHFPKKPTLPSAGPTGPRLLAGGAGLAPICHALMSSGLKGRKVIN